VARVKTRMTLQVKWKVAEPEAVPVLVVTGLEVLAVARLVRFVRNNPNNARYSAANDLRRGKPVMVL
jgi:hypothetical protein